jgi:hypothetical protein
MFMSALAVTVYMGVRALDNMITFFEEGKKEADKNRYTIKEFVSGEGL